MAELGALSLRIEAIGDKQVLAALNAIESKAKVVDKSVTDAVAALRELGIAAKAVGGQVAVAGADVEKATGLLAKMGLQARVVSKENIEAAKVESNANRVRARGFQEYLGLLSQGARLEGSRADAIRQLVSLEAALQKQLQQTNLSFAQQVRLGETLSRVQAGISSGIETSSRAATRSVAVQRTQVQGFTILGQAVSTTSGRLSAFSTRAIGGLNAASFALSSLAAGGTTSFRTLASAAAGFAAFFGPGGAIASIAITAGLAITDFFQRSRKEIEETGKKAVDELTKLSEAVEGARRQRDPASASIKLQDDLREQAEKQIEAASILHRTEAARTDQEKARLKVVQDRLKVLEQEIALGRQALTNPAQIVGPRGIPFRPITAQKPKTKEELQKEIAEEIAALASLSQSRGLSGLEVVRLTALERQLTAELRTGLPTKEREAEIWEQIAKARAAGARAIPPIGVRDPVSDRPQAANQLSLPPSLRAQLDPAKIQADVKRIDAEMARRMAAVNFHETQTSLSESLASALSTAIATGFSQGLSEGGIGEGFKQMAAQLAQGLGSVAVDYGLKAIITGEMMAKVSAFLVANPLLAIGAGLALVAFGRSIGGRRGSGGGSGGFRGGSGTSSVPLSISRLITDPNSGVRQRVASAANGLGSVAAPANPLDGVQFLVVNKPGGKRYLAELVGDANGRGIG